MSTLITHLKVAKLIKLDVGLDNMRIQLQEGWKRIGRVSFSLFIEIASSLLLEETVYMG